MKTLAEDKVAVFVRSVRVWRGLHDRIQAGTIRLASLGHSGRPISKHEKREDNL